MYTALNLFLLTMPLLSVHCSGQTKAPRPNIVLIQADDLGFDDLHIHGNPYLETPNLDKLGNEGLQFSQFYVNPVCAPSRASLLTGRNFLKTGVSHVHGGKDYLHLSEVTIAERLREAGYATGMWGKWHSGKTTGYFPWERGFEEAYMADLYRHANTGGWLNGVRAEHDRWADEVIVDYAMRFIEKQQGKPFFAYLSSMSCHTPLRAPEELVQKYRNKGLEDGLATLYAMVEMLDTQVGRLLGYLEERGLANNTIVLFLSDNGPAINLREMSARDRNARRIHDYKGYKGNIWENGVKSPLFVYWPGRIQPGTRPELADVTDLFPALVSLAGGSTAGLNLDGRDISPLFFGEKTGGGKLSFNYSHAGWPPTERPWSAEGVEDEYRPIDRHTLQTEEQIISVREQRYKLLLNPAANMNPSAPESGFALYDILEDPFENQNLIGQGLEAEPRLREALLRWFEEEIKGADHAFAMPLFRIAGDTSTVYAVGAAETSEKVACAFNWLGRWAGAGDQAKFALDVAKGGVFRLEISHNEAAAVPFDVIMDETVYPVVLIGEMTALEIGNLEKGRHTLVLRKSSDSGQLDRLHFIHFIRQDTVTGNHPGELTLQSGGLVFKVDPAVGGRISSLQFQGVELLATHRDERQLQWGSTVWPAPQSAWRWPPPPGMDRSVYRIKQATPKVIELESGPDAYQNIRVVKRFELVDSHAVRITYVFLNEGENTISTGIWENTRVACEGRASWKTGRLTDGAPASGFSRSGPVSTLQLQAQTEKKKLFIHSDGGWLAYHKKGVSLTKKFPVVPAGQVAPGQAPIEIYYDPVSGFAELEHHGSYVELEPGESTSLEVLWVLEKEQE